MSGLEVVVLAGGLGTRLRSLVSDRPKPMAEVHGEPFLAHLLRYHSRQGASRFILSIGYLGSQIADFFGGEFEGVPIAYAVENRPLGTGGAVLNSLKYLSSMDPFLLVNGDTFFSVDQHELRKRHLAFDAALTLALFEATESDRFGGVECNEQGQVTKFLVTHAVKGQPANGGAYMVSPEAMLTMSYFETPVSFENTLIPALISSDHRVCAHMQIGSFLDIGLPRDYLVAQTNDFE